MANFTVTISDSLNLLGIQPSNKWNVLQWGTDTWGAGSNGELQDVDHLVPEGLSLSEDLTYNPNKLMTNTLGFSSAIDLITLVDSAGYYHVFPGGVTDAEAMISTSWSENSATTPTYTKLTASSTSWVQA